MKDKKYDPIINEKIIDLMENNTKEAQATSEDYIRTEVLEGSFAWKILPIETADMSELERDLDEKLRMRVEIQPDTAGARYVPLQTAPEHEYLYGSSYFIPMSRVYTRQMDKDIAELYTYKMDLRKIVSELQVKEALKVIDAKFIDTVNDVVFDVDDDEVLNAEGTGYRQSSTGKIQWMDFAEPLSRETFAEATKMLPMPNANGKFVLRNHIALMNEVTARDILKLKREDIGGDLAEKNFVEGLSESQIMGINSLFTTKADVVPVNTIYFFAAPEFLGKAYEVHDWATFMETKAMHATWFHYWMGGFGFGNIAGFAVARFNVEET